MARKTNGSFLIDSSSSRTALSGVPIIVKNSISIKEGQYLYINNGVLDIVPDATTTETKPYAIALQDFTSASDNETVGKLSLMHHVIAPHERYYIKSDSALSQTNIGKIYRMSYGSNTHKVMNGTLATNGEFGIRIIQIDPYGEGDTSSARIQWVGIY